MKPHTPPPAPAATLAATLRSLFLAARPKTLPAGLVAVWAGCLVVYKYAEAFPDAGLSVSPMLAVCTALSSVCIQIACNFFNDALDSRRHADTARRQGPMRITANGRMSARAVQIWGCVFLAAAAAAAVPLIMAQGWGVAAIGIPCMICAYIYTGGPYPLAYHGLGELFVLLFFGLVAVVGTVYVQVGWHPDYGAMYIAAFMVGTVCGLLSCLLIEVNNIRDRAEDSTTGKRTLAVRLGEKRARGLAIAFLVAPYVVIRHLAAMLPGVGFNYAWPCAILVAGVILHKLMHTPADKRMNVLLALASLHMILYILALTLG